MYAHVNVWRLNDEGAAWDDAAAREVAERIAREPGFRSRVRPLVAEPPSRHEGPVLAHSAA
jgi:hypothetical protein